MKKCPFCAEEIQDEAIICRFCGHEVSAPKIEKKNQAGIRVYRLGVFYGMLAKMKVLVDGECLGKVAFLKDIFIPLEPGDHIVKVAMDWITSKDFSIKLHAGEVKCLQCGMPGGSIPQMKTLFAPKKVFFLEEFEPDEKF